MQDIKKLNKFWERNSKAIITIYALILLFRVFETVSIFLQYGFQTQVFFAEITGLAYDLSGSGLLIITYSAIHFLLSRVNNRLAGIVNGTMLFFSTLIFFLIVKYFLYQLIPLDIFLYKYTLDEILFTINTSDTNYPETFAGAGILLFMVSALVFVIHKIRFKPNTIKVIHFLVLISTPVFFLLFYFNLIKTDKFSLNKPTFFIGASIKYYFQQNDNAKHPPAEFNKLYPEKDFISEEYPLLYKADRENTLGNYFNRFDSSPNIVLLIVEGLNDDFIHEYKGAALMPFLSEFKNKSLYWKRCFTLGERSFAAVPSILGGLPYGETGFTLQERLPRHLSLVSILNANNYYTSFFYGQGAWFHRKDRFFQYNDADLIFDNSRFSPAYKKIIVGSDNFFWGYNDKDLFQQSISVTDTLKQNKRFDIYFTGTSHSPFAISNDAFYGNKLNEIKTGSNKDFFNTYSRYLKSVLFVDDALKDFFTAYKKRKDFKNTIFIITGDHPMTEIPIDNSLKRYHVPLLIYSEKLKNPQVFSETVSHLDISETLLSLLQEYLPHIPIVSTSLGDQLLASNKLLPKNIAFMNDNREVIDYLYGDYYLAGDQLYMVDSNLNIKTIENDSLKTVLKSRLSVFNHTTRAVSQNNKIISQNLYCKVLNHQCLHGFSQKESKPFSAEYFQIAANVLMPEPGLIYDVTFKIPAGKKDDVSIVYQISDSKDSTLVWKNFGINKDGITQIRIPVNKISGADSVQYFNSFLWNKSKSKLNISEIDILLHSQPRR